MGTVIFKNMRIVMTVTKLKEMVVTLNVWSKQGTAALESPLVVLSKDPPGRSVETISSNQPTPSNVIMETNKDVLAVLSKKNGPAKIKSDLLPIVHLKQ